MATYSTLTEQAAGSPGKVYVIVAKGSNSLTASNTFGRVAAVAQYGGLPIHFIRGGGINDGKIDASFLCLEMTADADIDPMVYMRSASVTFPPGTREVISSAPNCSRAIMEIEHVPKPEIEKRMAEMMSPLPSPFVLSIRASSGSPIGRTFDNAFVASLADAGLPHDIDPDEGFSPLDPNDPRPLVIESVRPNAAEFEVAHLSGKVCEAAFAMMAKTQAFILPPDDESPTIVLKGTTGGPPGRYQPLAIKFVASAIDLCAALRPAFDRWSTNHAALGAQGR